MSYLSGPTTVNEGSSFTFTFSAAPYYAEEYYYQITSLYNDVTPQTSYFMLNQYNPQYTIYGSVLQSTVSSPSFNLKVFKKTYYYTQVNWILVTERNVNITNTFTSAVSGPNSVSEGYTYNWTVNVMNNNSSQQLYYTIDPANQNSAQVWDDDFTDGTLSGQLPSNNTITKTLKADFIKEPVSWMPQTQEQFKINIRLNSTTGAIVATSPIIYVNDSSFTTISGPTSVNEGSSYTWNIQTNYSGTMYYSVEYNNGITPNDFISNTSGSFQSLGHAGNPSGSLSLTINPDMYTEGSENFILCVRLNSVTGQIVASMNIVINDTSTAPVQLYANKVISPYLSNVIITDVYYQLNNDPWLPFNNAIPFGPNDVISYMATFTPTSFDIAPQVYISGPTNLVVESIYWQTTLVLSSIQYSDSYSVYFGEYAY